MAIRKDAKGNFIADVYDIRGRKFIRKFSMKKEADAFIAYHNDMKKERRLFNSHIKKEKTPISIAIEEFTLTKNGLRPKSFQKYGFVFRQLNGFCVALNIKFVEDFTIEHAGRLYSELLKEKPDPRGVTDKIVKSKPSTVNFFLATVKAFFATEVLKGNITRNPVAHLKNLKMDKKQPDYYSVEEITAFFKQDIPARYRNAFTALLHTGMRFAEMANLKWDRIDFDKGLIQIKSDELFRTKTFNSQRLIPMNPTMRELLKTMYEENHSTVYVFCSLMGDKLMEKKLLAACKRIGKGAGIKSRCYLHKFRHTFASHLVQNGVAIEAIQKLLGHASINETMIYACLKPQGLHDQVSVLDKLF